MLSHNFNTEELIDQWIQEEDQGVQYPVDLDIAWQLAGYKKKQEGLISLRNNFIKGVDYIDDVIKNPSGLGRSVIQVKMSAKCFFGFVLASKSESGRAIRYYILSFLDGQSGQILSADFESATNSSRRKQEKDLSGFIYLVKATRTSFYKIGMSKNPYKRMKALQVGTPFELVILHRIYTFDCVALEKALHEYYQAYWLRGEWFDLPNGEIENFTSVASKLDQQIESTFLPESVE